MPIRGHTQIGSTACLLLLVGRAGTRYKTSAPVQRSKRVPAAKILVTCEVTIGCIGINSGTGEEWSDRENALTGAEAQAFKRALSCFGLGRYLYDVDGVWIEMDQHGVPKKIPRLPRWATPKGWLTGLRPKPRRNPRALARANGHSRNAEFRGHEVHGNGNWQELNSCRRDRGDGKKDGPSCVSWFAEASREGLEPATNSRERRARAGARSDARCGTRRDALGGRAGKARAGSRRKDHRVIEYATIQA